MSHYYVYVYKKAELNETTATAEQRGLLVSSCRDRGLRHQDTSLDHVGACFYSSF